METFPEIRGAYTPVKALSRGGRANGKSPGIRAWMTGLAWNQSVRVDGYVGDTSFSSTSTSDQRPGRPWARTYASKTAYVSAAISDACSQSAALLAQERDPLQRGQPHPVHASLLAEGQMIIRAPLAAHS